MSHTKFCLMITRDGKEVWWEFCTEELWCFSSCLPHSSCMCACHQVFQICQSWNYWEGRRELKLLLLEGRAESSFLFSLGNVVCKRNEVLTWLFTYLATIRLCRENDCSLRTLLCFIWLKSVWWSSSNNIEMW